jgi:hypothetical protein
MKISQDTIALLKNFSTINNSLFVKAGNKLWSASSDKSIIAYGEIAETFPVDFGIYDLGRFLSLISFFDSPEFNFKDDYVIVSSSNSETKYRFADSAIISHRNDFNKVESYLKNKAHTFEYPVSFQLKNVDLQDFLKKSSILKLPDIAITTDSTLNVILKSHDKKNDLSDNHILKLEETSTTKFSAFISVEKIKMIDGDYQVKISENVINFINTKHNIEYWVAPDADSELN